MRHPQYGVGVVKSDRANRGDRVDDAPRTIAPASSDLQPAEATATLRELEVRSERLFPGEWSSWDERHGRLKPRRRGRWRICRLLSVFRRHTVTATVINLIVT